MSEPVKLIICGCGGRGTGYANWVLNHPDRAKIAAVAEPRDFYRNRIGDQHNIPEEMRFRSWEEVAARPKFADAVLICMMDDLHEIPAVTFADMGYHIMLEKPMAPTEEACRRIADAVRKSGILFAVCHVMRYTYYTRQVKKLIDEGKIGRIVTIQHLEPVGHWRFAHSFVRGNWRRESESSPVLLAKSAHDIDWIRYIVGSPAARVSSFGSLMFFRQENRPAGASPRCADCAVAGTCPYDAVKFYTERLRAGTLDAYVESVTGTPTQESLLENLRVGPYGRCVFACDNDVADHQVVNVEFESGATASFTLAGCSKYGDRRITIFGSLGEISGDGENIFLSSYLAGTTERVPVPAPRIAEDRHGGGDFNLLDAFVEAVLSGDARGIVSGADVSLETHALAFAAEAARRENRIVEMRDFLR